MVKSGFLVFFAVMAILISSVPARLLQYSPVTPL